MATHFFERDPGPVHLWKVSDRMSAERQRVLAIKGCFVVLIITASAVVLSLRGTPHALLGTDFFEQSIFTVAFWALPALGLYLLLPWSMAAAVAEGNALAALFFTTWWSSTTDTHSTAGLGPGPHWVAHRSGDNRRGSDR